MSKRVRERYHDMSIILLTGYADFEYARRGIELQVTDYCLKPIDTEQLTATLRRAVRQVRALLLTFRRAAGSYRGRQLSRNYADIF